MRVDYKKGYKGNKKYLLKINRKYKKELGEIITYYFSTS